MCRRNSATLFDSAVNFATYFGKPSEGQRQERNFHDSNLGIFAALSASFASGFFAGRLRSNLRNPEGFAEAAGRSGPRASADLAKRDEAAEPIPVGTPTRKATQ